MGRWEALAAQIPSRSEEVGKIVHARVGAAHTSAWVAPEPRHTETGTHRNRDTHELGARGEGGGGRGGGEGRRGEGGEAISLYIPHLPIARPRGGLYW